MELHEPPRTVLPDGYARHPQRDGPGREDDGHLIGEPAHHARGPARRRARLEGDPAVLGLAVLGQAVVQPLNFRGPLHAPSHRDTRTTKGPGFPQQAPRPVPRDPVSGTSESRGPCGPRTSRASRSAPGADWTCSPGPAVSPGLVTPVPAAPPAPPAGRAAGLTRRIRLTWRIWAPRGYRILHISHFLHVIAPGRHLRNRPRHSRPASTAPASRRPSSRTATRGKPRVLPVPLTRLPGPPGVTSREEPGRTAWCQRAPIVVLVRYFLSASVTAWPGVWPRWMVPKS